MIDEKDDIKIVGDKPSLDVERNKLKDRQGVSANKELSEKAKKIGELTAQNFVKEAAQKGTKTDSAELIIQRRLLLSFTVTACFEQYIKDDALIGIAQKSFLDTLKKSGDDLYKSASDTGAFSFYYLAYRRDIDVERRIGQTFAMLCSHDGDPIFQELGEALYCWFSSVVRKTVKEYLP